MDYTEMVALCEDLTSQITNDNPTFVAVVHLRDLLAEEYGIEIANKMAATVTVNVPRCTPEQAKVVAAAFAVAIFTLVEMFRDHKFDINSIITYMSGMKLEL